MPLRTAFGTAGHELQAHLPGTDTALLPGPSGPGAPPRPDALSSPAYVPAGDGSDTLFGGRVTATTAGSGGAPRTLFDVVGPWNSVKNAAAAADAAARLAFVGFVHVDAAVGLASDLGSTLELVGAKRGNLLTGGGADLIDVRVASNGAAWSNEFRIAAGAGGDAVRLSLLDVTATAAAGDVTFASGEAAMPGGGYRGWATTAWIDLGEGADSLTVEGGIRADVRGGAGDDRIQLGDPASGLILMGDMVGDAHGDEGDDLLAGGRSLDLLAGDGGADTLSGGDEDDTLRGGDGDDLLDGGGGGDRLDGGEGDDAATYAGRAGDYEILLSPDNRHATVRDLNPADGDEGADALLGVERLRFADRAVELPPPGPPAARFVFAGGHGRYGESELSVSDGTAAGTHLLVDINPGPSSSDPHGFVALGGGRALFAADDGATGSELWVSDGTATGTHPLADINPGRGSSSPGGFFALGGGRALFSAFDGGEPGGELWVTDGTTAGTRLVEDIWSGSGLLGPEGFFAFAEGRALFRAHQAPAFDPGLWVTDGTAEGTRLVKDIHPYRSSHPSGFFALGDGRALFLADDGDTGRELWVSDGTAEGTRLVKDIHPGRHDGTSPDFIALGGGRALFAASDGAIGAELWVTDGTAAGTRLVADIAPGAEGSGPRHFVALGEGRALFSTAYHGSWISDGTAVGTAPLADIELFSGVGLDPLG